MNIGLNINEEIKIKIGETFDNITQKLEAAKVDYKIPFKGRNALSEHENEQSIVIFLEKYGVELNVLDDKVVYIKSTDYGSNLVVNIGSNSVNPADILHDIIKKLSEVLEVGESCVKVESFDMLSYNAVFRVKTNSESIKISVICADRNVYIHTVRLV